MHGSLLRCVTPTPNPCRVLPPSTRALQPRNTRHSRPPPLVSRPDPRLSLRHRPAIGILAHCPEVFATPPPQQPIEGSHWSSFTANCCKQCPGPGEKCLVPARETCRPPGEDKCSVGHSFEPELQEEGINRGEKGLNPGVEAGEERGPKPALSIVRPSHGTKRKPIKPLVPGLATTALPGPSYHAQPRAEAELPPGMLLQKEEPEGSHSESTLPAKQHKKAKKRKSVGAPVPPAVASTSAPTEMLRLERKAQRLRPLYQYINYCNPELNQAGDSDGEPEVEPKSELAPAPEAAGVEQLHLRALVPVAGQEVGGEPGGLSSLRVRISLKAEVDKTTQVDIDKMLSVCAAPLVPPLSPQYK